jgi:chemotaxis protein CheD
MDSGRYIYITQGECRISSDPITLLSTVLGSCVAACIWDPQAGVGGMNHFLLPFGPAAGRVDPLRYGVHSMEVLTNELLKQGANRKYLQAKLFGGATMLANLGRIGESNASFARDYLANEDIPCLAEDLGGTHARRVVFHPTSGQARLMKVRSTDVGAQVDVSPQLLEPRENDVVLF